MSFPGGLVLTRQTAFTLPLTPGRGEQSGSLAVAMGDRYENQLLGCVTPATVSGRLWPVSYTHLDVYKRQISIS